MRNKATTQEADKHRNIPRACIVALAISASLSFNGCSQDPAESPQATTPSNVVLTAAQRQNIHLFTVASSSYHKTIEANGVVDFDNDQATSVLAPFSGPVSRLLVSPGEQVKKGQPLAIVDSPDFATALGTYRKALATAQTTRHLADLDKDLLEHKSIGQREQEQAETDATNAEADRDAALQTLVSLNIDSQTLRDIQSGRSVSHVEGIIRSPISGTVVEKLITPGELLQAGVTPCFTVADLSRVWVMAQIFGSNLTSVGVGDTADVESGIGSTKFSGTVDNISAQVDPNTRSVAVRVAVQNPESVLKKQMYVRVVIRRREESHGFLVPVSAILRDDENLPFVYMAQRDGTFARQHVTLGDRIDDQFEISAGLLAGAQIVVDGGIFLQFMQSQ